MPTTPKKQHTQDPAAGLGFVDTKENVLLARYELARLQQGENEWARKNSGKPAVLFGPRKITRSSTASVSSCYPF